MSNSHGNKYPTKMSDSVNTWAERKWQFHHLFTISFFVQKFYEQHILFSSFSTWLQFGRRRTKRQLRGLNTLNNIWQKNCLPNVGEIDNKWQNAALMSPKKLTTKFPMTTVARKKGTQTLEATTMQSHMDSIHSPQRTLKTIMKLCMKSTKFQRGSSLDGNLSVLSGKKENCQWGI